MIVVPVAHKAAGFFSIKMNQELAQYTYEQIDNYILRLLLYFGGAVIVALSSALVYLWHAWRTEQKERIDLDRINAAAMNSVANELDNIRERCASMERTIAEKLTALQHEKRSR